MLNSFTQLQRAITVTYAGSGGVKQIVGGTEGVWGWNPHPGRPTAGRRILAKALIGFWTIIRQNLH